MVGELFLSYSMQLLFTVGTVLLFGLLTYLANKGVYALAAGGKAVCYATGLIGTPVHEGAHALMCLLFGHKITEIALYRVDDDGVLGYVHHSYNKRNLWHQIGNFFIGTAPVLVGSGLIALFLFAFVPSSYDALWTEIALTAAADSAEVPWLLLLTVFKSFAFVFAPANFANGLWYLFLALSLCIALHVNLSPADLKNALPGMLFLAILYFVLDLVLALVQHFAEVPALTVVTDGMVSAGTMAACFMALSLVLSVALLAVVALVHLIVKLVARK